MYCFAFRRTVTKVTINMSIVIIKSIYGWSPEIKTCHHQPLLCLWGGGPRIETARILHFHSDREIKSINIGGRRKLWNEWIRSSFMWWAGYGFRDMGATIKIIIIIVMRWQRRSQFMRFPQFSAAAFNGYRRQINFLFDWNPSSIRSIAALEEEAIEGESDQSWTATVKWEFPHW